MYQRDFDGDYKVCGIFCDHVSDFSRVEQCYFIDISSSWLRLFVSTKFLAPASQTKYIRDQMSNMRI